MGQWNDERFFVFKNTFSCKWTDLMKCFKVWMWFAVKKYSNDILNEDHPPIHFHIPSSQQYFPAVLGGTQGIFRPGKIQSPQWVTRFYFWVPFELNWISQWEIRTGTSPHFRLRKLDKPQQTQPHNPRQCESCSNMVLLNSSVNFVSH